jgi:hypothetical protein
VLCPPFTAGEERRGEERRGGMKIPRRGKRRREG